MTDVQFTKWMSLNEQFKKAVFLAMNVNQTKYLVLFVLLMKQLCLQYTILNQVEYKEEKIMRIKIYSKKANKNVVMEVNVVEPYIRDEKRLYADGIVFDIDSKEEVEEMLDRILKCGFLNLTSYSYMRLDGMCDSKIML